jgi:hypothetical protein
MRGNTLLVLPCFSRTARQRLAGGAATAEAERSLTADWMAKNLHPGLSRDGDSDRRSRRKKEKPHARREAFFFFYSISSEYQIERLTMPTLLGCFGL